MNSEVKALEWAVSALVAKLDMLLCYAVDSLSYLDARHGLHISTPDHLSLGQDAFVTIRPTGWPAGACITARFYRSSGGWTLYEGGLIDNPFLPFIGPMRFVPSDDPIGVRLEPCGDSQRSSAKAGYDALIEILQQDVTKL